MNTITRKALAVGAAMIAAASISIVPISASAVPVATDADTSTSECHIGSRVIALWAHAPAELKDDLKDLRGLTPEERREVAATIKQDALDGTYGEGVQARAERLRERRITNWSQMPDELQNDLKQLAAAEPGDERRVLASEIADTALAGGYGDRAQNIAQHVQEHCAAE